MRQVFCRFAEFELDRSAFQLRRKGRPVSLERIPLDLLFFLAERRGNLVTRQEIVDRIWGKNVFLDVDNAVNTAVRKIRRALRDDSECPRFVETVPAKGYRFVAPVHESHSSPEPASRLRHPRTSLVGREREMATLLAGLEEAVSGTGRLILISGEPGIGKTRLADELAERAQANRMVLLVGRCTGDERAAPFLPFVEILESIVSHTPGPENLRTALGEQGPELARLLPRLKTMVPEFSPRTDLGPAEVRRHLFSCYCDLVKRIARERSALMILDDLHWADDSTLALLEHLTQRLADIPMLVVGTYRDAELDLVRGLGNFLEKLLRGRAATHVKLKALLPDGVEAVLQSLSGQEPPAGVTETIFAESTGNPFLIEELFRHLEEENRLYDSAGKFRRRLEISDQEAPPTVRLVVSRRLERLSDKTRKILGTAAVIGRWFTFEVLRSSCEADADAILECVEEAEKSGLISSVEDSPGARFEFSHELVRQAVIAGMSAARRQALHVTVARTIERVNPSAIEDHLAELAHHYRLGGNRAKAIDYLRRAGEQAVAHAMYSEAESYFAAAQDEITPMPASPERDALELGVCSSFAETMSVSRGYGALEVLEMASRAHVLAEKTGNLPELVQQLWMEVGFAEARGDLASAGKLVNDLLAVAKREGSSTSLAMAYTYQVENRYFRGDFLGAEDHFERGRAFFEAPGFSTIQYGPAAAFGQAAWSAWIVGHPDVARERMQRALERTHRNPYDTTVLSQMSAVLHLFLREFAEADAVAAKALLSSEERGFVEQAMWHRIPLGAARAELGRAEEGIDLLRQVILRMTESGRRVTITQVLTHLAKAQALAGAISEALITIEDALHANDEELYVRPETYRVRGELRLHRGDRLNAEYDFREAISIAQKMSAKAWELRATTSLARLLQQTRRRDEARAMLAEIYNWFTEGFDTADLKNAKALLEELSE